MAVLHDNEVHHLMLTGEQAHLDLEERLLVHLLPSTPLYVFHWCLLTSSLCLILCLVLFYFYSFCVSQVDTVELAVCGGATAVGDDCGGGAIVAGATGVATDAEQPCEQCAP